MVDRGSPAQGFPQVLRTRGALQNLMGRGGGLSQYMRGAWGVGGGASNAVEKYM